MAHSEMKFISQTKLKVRKARKTNPEIVATISAASEHKEWLAFAKIISSSTRKYTSINISDIEKMSKEGDIIVVAGKVLGSGDLTKKIRICALGASQSALNKLKKTKSEYAQVMDEIKKNPKASGVKFI